MTKYRADVTPTVRVPSLRTVDGMASRMGAGIAAAAVALGVTQLLAAPLGSAADARTAVGSAIIDLTPGAAKEWAIRTFGTSDKLFLTVTVLIVILLLAAIAATWETRTRPVGSAVLAAAGLAGAAAVLSRPGAGIVDTLPVLAGAGCGVVVLRRLTARRPTEPDRRHALVTLGLTGAGVAAGLAGAGWGRRLHSIAPEQQAFTAPPVAVPAPPIPAQVQPIGIDLPSFLTPNDEFYRIDTALSVPQLSRTDWRLRVHGMVDRETTFDMTALAHLPVVEKVVTLTCVSNPIGGDLISNATWTGYRVRDILAAVGVHPDADMVLSMSVDGFTAGTPVEALTDGRDALLAITMNGAPLPAEHGYPARLVVPGLYGYVSATKWVVDLELTRFDRAQAYWTRLGWSERGPIKTESRIDVPRSGAEIDRGPVVFGGVAWAQHRGVRAVEVRIDSPASPGVWQPAEMGASYSADTWRLWSFPWQAREVGPHTLTVRATDNTGAVQTADTAPPPPDGATGWHRVEFSVR